VVAQASKPDRVKRMQSVAIFFMCFFLPFSPVGSPIPPEFFD